MALDDPVERLHHDLGVACARQLPGRVAQRDALALVAPRAERGALQAHERPRPLERLARLVDSLRCRRGIATLEQRDRQVELLQRRVASAVTPAECSWPALGGSRAAFALGARHGHCNAEAHDRAQRRQNGCVPRLPPAAWWTARRAASHKPATYRCPICGRHLPALSEHMLIAPEGDTRRRRHAHTACVCGRAPAGRAAAARRLAARPAAPPVAVAAAFCGASG